ncbi:MAG: aspartate-semialdehyde dehydrogenase [Gemmatimonadaceae bacterium]|nr:aspartate-semialdehyde dehydrogenase [Gemmatimonadaceae bacterium]MCW5825331.1 aspartate-semialdehyde dehydrogenase [Gemmatimonadaceae bacterium]
MSDPRLPVAILGATGAVGQTFVRLLAGHPWFRLAEVAASDRSAGKRYEDATKWIEGTMPAEVKDLVVTTCDPAEVKSKVVFSAMDAVAAETVEPAFAAAGRFVLSNTKTFRMTEDVPLVIPEVNANHLALLDAQRARGWSGGVVTNANCAAIAATMALAPLHERFGLTELFIATMQAVSGAGYPGVPSLDILGNVIPYIGGDEEGKIEREMQKMLGTLEGTRIAEAPFVVSAHANRVPVEHGHTVVMSAKFRQKPSPSEAIAVIRNWQGEVASLRLPSSPARPLVLAEQPDRPQPRRDVQLGNGMTVTVGRVREDAIFHLKLVAMGHNTIRGAAGGAVLNAEVLATTGRLGWTPPGRR